MRTETSAQASRRAKKELARRLRSADPGLEVVHPDAAGIDVGNGSHYVAVRPDRDPEPVRRFACFTADLYRMAEWLRGCGVKTVAMQSTGVYWIPLCDILEEFGFEVFLVNARHTKNLPGRKSDVQESQWLLKLHTHGLLNNSFQPPSDIRVLRTYWRLRAEHATGMATCIQRMQKALTQMNIQLANVISDLSGRTGQAIIRAILNGERDPQKLAELSDHRIHATKEEIAKSLQGNWRPNCCSSCDSSSKCMRLISDGSPNVIKNYGNIWQSSQVPHQHPSIRAILLRVRSRRGIDTCPRFRSVTS